MSWFILIASGAFEAVWATALAASRGFRKPIPVIVFLVALLISVGGLGYALIELPTGTAYAVWVATGAVLTTVWALITKKERATFAKIGLIFALVVCVAGLQVVSS